MPSWGGGTGGGTGGRETGRKEGGRPGEKGAGGVREAEEKGAGGVQEAGEKGAGSGIPKVAGSGRKREKLCNIAQYLQLKKCKEAGANKYRTGTGIKGYRERQVSTPLFPPPPTNLSFRQIHFACFSQVPTCPGFEKFLKIPLFVDSDFLSRDWDIITF